MSGETTAAIRDVRLCTDQEGQQAIYVDGVRKFSDSPVCAVDLADTCGDGPCTVRHHYVLFYDDSEWPKSFSDLTLEPTEEAS